MAIDIPAAVEDWFAKHGDDGEFVAGQRAAPYCVIGPLNDAKHVVFTTKPAIIAGAIERAEVGRELGMIGRYGLPETHDIPWIRRLVRGRALLFLGDLDPPDLLVFAWLRRRFRGRRIAHVGIHDGLLETLGVRRPRSLSIRCSNSEQEAIGVTKLLLPNVERIIGRSCAQLLAAGEKLELEAIANRKGAIAAMLRAARERREQ